MIALHTKPLYDTVRLEANHSHKYMAMLRTLILAKWHVHKD
jgi:hypothetical protein